MREEMKLSNLLFEESLKLKKNIYSYYNYIAFYKKVVRKKPYQKRASAKVFYVKSYFNNVYLKNYIYSNYVKFYTIKQYDASFVGYNYPLFIFVHLYLNYIKISYRFIILLLLINFLNIFS